MPTTATEATGFGWYRRHVGKRKGHAYRMASPVGPIDFGTVRRVFDGQHYAKDGKRVWRAELHKNTLFQGSYERKDFDDCQEAMDWVQLQAIEQMLLWGENVQATGRGVGR